MLSHTSPQQRQQFVPPDRAAFEQCQHQAQIRQQERQRAGAGARRVGAGVGRRQAAGALAVERFLLAAARRRAVISHAAPVGTRLTVRLPAAKGAAQVAAAGVARIGEEEYPAVRATPQALAQSRNVPQRRPQTAIVAQGRCTDLGPAIPARGIVETFPDFQRVKAKSWLKLLNRCLFMSSSLADLPAVRERKDEDFLLAPTPASAATTPTTWKRKTCPNPPPRAWLGQF